MKLFVFSFFIFSLEYSYSDIAKDLHNGAYDLLKGAIDGATEVIGTPVNLEEVLFYLHTKNNIYANHTVDPLNPAEMATTKGKIFFLIHGWTQSREKTPWFKPLTEIIFDRYQEPHVIQIDWGKAAANNYAFAAFTTESVGEIVGNVIYKLVKEYNVPLKNIVIIGHSLGGQVSGWAGKKFQELTNSKLPRIIALDPAGPLFSLRPKEKRLNADDADFVVAVHTDGGKLGFKKSCGTIDFFPNGGSNQPGCFQVDLANVSTLTDPIWCDHRRAYDLFVEAVRTPEHFMAKKCANYSYFKMGKCENETVSLGDFETTELGSFYLDTGGVPPFTIEENNDNNYTEYSDNNLHQEKNPQISSTEGKESITNSTHESHAPREKTSVGSDNEEIEKTTDIKMRDEEDEDDNHSNLKDGHKIRIIKTLQDNYERIKKKAFDKL